MTTVREKLAQVTSQSQLNSFFIDKMKVYNVKSYGAKGDGVTDDTLSIQATIDACSVTGGMVYYPAGTYLISSELQSRVTVQLSPALTGSDLHFSDIHVIHHISWGKATIKAIAAMTNMLRTTFNSTLNDISPYYSVIEGISFDGNNLATNGIYIEWTLKVTVRKCTFHGLTIGIVNFGYGVHDIVENTFKCKTGIFIQRGGDNLLQFNDFFPLSSGICIDLGGFSGNTKVFSNIFSREDSIGTIIGVRLSGDYSTDGSQEVRDIVIDSNEFSGLTVGVQGNASTATDNVYNCIITNNHVIHNSTSINCELVNMTKCKDIKIDNNFMGGRAYPNLYRFGEFFNCQEIEITNNKIYNISDVAILLSTSYNFKIEHNDIINFGKSTAGQAAISMFGASITNRIKNNYFSQDSTLYGQVGISENAGGDNNIADYNEFTNISIPYSRSGANSVFKQRQYSPETASTSVNLVNYGLSFLSYTTNGGLGYTINPPDIGEVKTIILNTTVVADTTGVFSSVYTGSTNITIISASTLFAPQLYLGFGPPYAMAQIIGLTTSSWAIHNTRGNLKVSTNLTFAT